MWDQDSNDNMYGGNGNGTIRGGSGRDTLLGESGNDTISGGSGRDSIVADWDTDMVNAKGDYSDLICIDFDTTVYRDDLDKVLVASCDFEYRFIPPHPVRG